MTRFMVCVALGMMALADSTKAQSLVETLEKTHGQSAWGK